MMGLWRQHPNTSDHWTSDWSQLADIGRTITSATATSSTPGVTIDDVSYTAYEVVYRLSTDGSLPDRSYVKVTVNVTLDNTDTDATDALIEITTNA